MAVSLQQADEVTRIEHLASGLLVGGFQILAQRHSEKESFANYGNDKTYMQCTCIKYETHGAIDMLICSASL